MSYLDQTSRNKPRTIAAVTILHVGLGYLIVSGLAINVIKYVPQITPTHIYEDTKTPPPRTDPPPPPRNAREDPLPQSPDPLVKSNIERVTTIDVLPQGPVKPVWSDPGPIAPPPPDPPKESLARAVEPGGGRAGWVTSEDYPPGALREGVTGTVGISVAIGIDGRVQGCEVTKSSGNAQLDDTTCRLYARRARFKPGLDAEGKPVAAHFADRIRWELPM
jgi:protein TonB